MSSKSGATDEEEASNITQAVIWAEHARHGSLRWVERLTKGQLYFYVLQRRTTPFYAQLGLLGLTLLEQPGFCREGGCEAARAESLYSWHLPLLPHAVAAGSAMLFWLVLLWRMLLQRKALGAAYFLGYGVAQWTAFGYAVVVLGMASTLASFSSGSVSAHNVAILFRPLIIVSSNKKLRYGFSDITESLPGIVDVVCSLFLAIFIFVWIGMMLFVKTSEGHAVFSNWWDGLSNMWILHTTANSPTAFTPAYNENRVYAMFFILYLVGTLYLLGSILLARVYEIYKERMKNMYLLLQRNRHTALLQAYSLLSDDTGRISTETWNQFFVEYCDPHIGGLRVEDTSDSQHNMEKTKLVLKAFHGIDANPQGGLDFDCFTEIMAIFLDRHFYIPCRHSTQGEPKSLARDFLAHGFDAGFMKFTWDGCVDFIIFIALLLTFTSTVGFVGPGGAGETLLLHTASFWGLFLISMIYTLTLSWKIGLLGFSQFWNLKPLQHRLDFFGVYGLVAIELAYVFVSHSLCLERVILLLHLARGLRILYYVGPLHHLGQVVVRALPAFWQMTMVLVVIFYIFASIGMACFGGLLYEGNPVLKNSNFASNNMWAFNFNDLPSGIVTLFVCMVASNWYYIAEACFAVVGGGPNWYFTGAYFVGFYVLCNLVVLNIVIALILDASTTFAEAPTKSQPSSELQELAKQDPELLIMEGQVRPEAMLRKMFAADADERLQHLQLSKGSEQSHSPAITS